MHNGVCKFGIWRVNISWDDNNIIHHVCFVNNAQITQVPIQFTRYFAGKQFDFSPFRSIVLSWNSTYSKIYEAVAKVPYGETRTYNDISKITNTNPRIVGNALSKNPTPLIIPCHRIIRSDGNLGGFTPDPQIKFELLSLESKYKPKLSDIAPKC